MLSRRLARRLASAALLVAGLSVLAPARYNVLICRWTGFAHAMSREGCCPGDRQDAQAPASHVGAQGCCTLRNLDLSSGPVDRQAGGPTVLAAARPTPIATAPLVLAPALTAPSSPPAWRGPPLILAKRSFLI